MRCPAMFWTEDLNIVVCAYASVSTGTAVVRLAERATRYM